VCQGDVMEYKSKIGEIIMHPFLDVNTYKNTSINRETLYPIGALERIIRLYQNYLSWQHY
jgi:hypothetical protein